MAVRFKLVRNVALFLLLFCFWKAPSTVSPKSDALSVYTPLMLTDKTNVLFADDVALNLHYGVDLPSLLAGISVLVCLLGLVEVEGVCRLDESYDKIVLKIIQR